jgi:glycosyltransferase involved in cell wall biosynthesis
MAKQMELANITPLVMTYNEEPNLRDTLARLSWAKQVIVIDSFSVDATIEIANSFPNVQVFQRAYENPTSQGNFGLTKVQTEWCLSMDADYKCTPEFVREIAALEPACDSYSVGFIYSIYGKTLRGSLYPPRTVLYRTSKARYEPDGHTQRVKIDGTMATLKSCMIHDDRKDIKRWIASQLKYADQEAEKLQVASPKELGWIDWLRARTWLAPLVVLFYCLCWKGLIFDGIAGAAYTFQRVYAEVLLCLLQTDRKANDASNVSD